MSNLLLAVRRLFAGRARLTLLCLGLAAGLLIAHAHRVHALGAPPYLLLLAFPPMHVFMMRGHAGYAHGREGADDRPKRPAPDA